MRFSVVWTEQVDYEIEVEASSHAEALTLFESGSLDPAQSKETGSQIETDSISVVKIK